MSPIPDDAMLPRNDPSSDQPSNPDTDPTAAPSDASFLQPLTFETRPSESPTHLASSAGSRKQPLRAASGDIVGDYTLTTPIAHGGMGEVWEALDRKLQRTVALKLIRPDKLTEDLRRRFVTESQAQARLHHDGIAQIFQADADGARPFIAMELIRGAQRLDVFVKHHRLSVIDRLALLRKIADAIAHAHEQHVIHLDLKPSNILIRADGQPKILDFGGGRITDIPITDADVAIATPQYMSPEQSTLDLRRVDARSDIYTLAVVAHELFEGALPYDLSGRTFSEVRDEICGPHPPKTLTRLAGSARRDIGAVIRHALEKDPRARYQSMGAFRDDIAALINGGTVSVTSDGPLVRTRRWLRDAQHIPRTGHFLSVVSWLIAGVCIWFIVIAVALPGLRAVVTPQVRVREFVVHESEWIVFLVAVGVCARAAGRGKALCMWLMLIIVLVLCAFTMSVASGRLAYDAGGSAADPVARTLVFTLLSGITLVSLLLTVVMLASHYARAPWGALATPSAVTAAGHRPKSAKD